MTSLGSRSFFKASRERELGLPCHLPSFAFHLAGLTTTREDEYGFWNLSPGGVPYASPPFSMTFSTTLKDGHALLATDEEGVITVLDTTRSLRDQMNGSLPDCYPIARFRAHENAIFDGIFLRDDSRVATASGDGSVRIFDVATTYRVAVINAARGSVKSVRSQPGHESILATASRDGSIRLFDLRAPTVPGRGHSRSQPSQIPVLAIDDAHPASGSAGEPSGKRRKIAAKSGASVTCLAWEKEMELISGGAADGAVKLWDVRNAGGSSCLEEAIPGFEGRCSRAYGVASLHVAGQRLAVSCTDSTVYLYEANALGLGYSYMLKGHTQTSFYIRSRVSPCGGFVMSGSADSNAYIWDLSEKSHNSILTPILRLEGHRGGDASCVAWCGAERVKVATCGDDTTLKVWNIVEGKEAAEPGRSDGIPLDGARKVKTVAVRRAKPKTAKKKRTLRNADIRSFFKPKTPS